MLSDNDLLVPETRAPDPRQPQPAASKNRGAVPAGSPFQQVRRNGFLPWVILAVVTAGVIWYFWTRPPASAAAGAGARQGGPVPVVAGTVTTQDVPIFLDGIGTVQAFNTVTVHSRVDGQVQKIAFVEGQQVKQGDTLAIIDPGPFVTVRDQAIGKRGQDFAQLNNAKLDLVRDTDLLQRKVISSQVYDTQKALVDQLVATVAADDAAIANAQVQVNYTTITAPLSGRVGLRQIDQGNIIHAADANGLCVITQLQPISVLFTLPEQNLAQIHKQSPSANDLPVLAVDRDDKTVLDSGTLSVINNEIDTTTGTISLKATFGNEHFQLWPGQFINARLLLTTRKGGVVVPASVIQRGPDGSFAYVIKPDQTAEVRPVKVAQIDNNVALLDSGLQPGERVVVDGQYKLRPGAQVKLPDASGAPGRAGGAHAGGSPGAHGGHHGGGGGTPAGA